MTLKCQRGKLLGLGDYVRSADSGSYVVLSSSWVRLRLWIRNADLSSPASAERNWSRNWCVWRGGDKVRKKWMDGSRVCLKDRKGLFKDSDGLRGTSCRFPFKDLRVNTVFLETTKGTKYWGQCVINLHFVRNKQQGAFHFNVADQFPSKWKRKSTTLYSSFQGTLDKPSGSLFYWSKGS